MAEIIKKTKKRGRPPKSNLPAVSGFSAQERIIGVAESLYAERGFSDGVSIREVAVAANVDVALISHYFKHKQGLKAAVILSQLKKQISTREKTIDLSNDPLINLKDLLHGAFDSLNDVEERYRIRQWALAEGGAITKAMLTHIYAPLFDTVLGIIKRGMPKASSSDTEARAFAFLSLCENYAQLRWLYTKNMKFKTAPARLLYEYKRFAERIIIPALLTP